MNRQWRTNCSSATTAQAPNTLCEAAPLPMLFNCLGRKTSVFVNESPCHYMCCIIYHRKVGARRHECRDCFIPVLQYCPCQPAALQCGLVCSAMGVDWSKACAGSNATPLDDLISILYGIGGVTVG